MRFIVTVFPFYTSFFSAAVLVGKRTAVRTGEKTVLHGWDACIQRECCFFDAAPAGQKTRRRVGGEKGCMAGVHEFKQNATFLTRYRRDKKRAA